MKVGIVAVMAVLTAECSQVSNSISRDVKYKDQLIAVGKRAYERQLYWGTGGDISVRVPQSDRFLIKASMTCLGDMDKSRITTVSLDDTLARDADSYADIFDATGGRRHTVHALALCHRVGKRRQEDPGINEAVSNLIEGRGHRPSETGRNVQGTSYFEGVITA